MFNLPDADEQPHPVTLPKIPWLDKAPLDDAEEIAERFATQRVIKTGRDAWLEIGKAGSFENWKSISAALAIGRTYALRVTGANRAWGRNYSRAFCDWSREHKFDAMPSPTRSACLKMYDHLPAIEQWRTGLSEKERRRLAGPLQNFRRWQAATAQPKTTDDVLKATTAWRRFVACVEALPADQAAPLWREIYEQAAAVIIPA
jgi:hypothetical protein